MYLCLSAHPHRPVVGARHGEFPNHSEFPNFRIHLLPPFSKRYLPPTMPKTAESTESRMNEACEATRREKKPNLSKIAREYGVCRRTLYNRVKKGIPARACSTPVNKALDRAHEEALVRWIV
jgi:DNA-binding phage protein